MTDVFLQVLNMSLTASYVIAVVLLLRLLLRRLPKQISYLLWSAVAFRLCCPISWQSVFSLFSLTPLTGASTLTQVGGAASLNHFPAALSPAPGQTVTGAAQAGETITGPILPEIQPGVGSAGAAVPQADPLQLVLTIAAVIWCVGMAALLIYSVVCYLQMKRHMRTAVLLRENIYQSEYIRSPFLLGLIRPKIYIPYGLDENTLRYVLAHERYHIRRRDYLVKPFAFLLLTVHWFNPLCWLAFYLMSRDMEMSCDEKVLGAQGNSVQAYSTALLSFALPRRFPAPSPLAFGEAGVKSRIKNVLHWKKPRLWVTLAAALLCVLAVVACTANPAQSPDDGQDADVPPEAEQTGQYASMEEFARQTMQATQTATYFTGDPAPATANVLATKLEQLEKLGEVSDLVPEGLLEAWRFHFLIQVDVENIVLVGGQYEEDGWYDLEGQGGHYLVALRYADGSYDILYDEPVNDGLDFYGYHHSYEEAIYDWYVAEYGLDLPLYVIDLRPDDELGNHPAHRYDGDGWYLYIPIQAWELTEETETQTVWRSQYGTGSTLTVRKVSDGEGAAKPPAQEGLAESYYESTTGTWCVSTRYDPENITDYPYIAIEPDTLQAMADSFTVDARFQRAPAQEQPLAMQTVLEGLTMEGISALTWEDGAQSRELTLSSAVVEVLRSAAGSLHRQEFSAPAGGVRAALSETGDRCLRLYPGDAFGQVLLQYEADGAVESAAALDNSQLSLFLTAVGENGGAELHDLEGDGSYEGLVWLSRNNRTGLVIYGVWEGQLHRIDVNETLGCSASNYAGLIANLPAEYQSLIVAYTDDGADLYRYTQGELSYVCPLSEALG